MRLFFVVSFFCLMFGCDLSFADGQIRDPAVRTFLLNDLVFVGTIKSVKLADERDTWIPHRAVAVVDGKVYRGEPNEKEVSFLTINQGTDRAPKVGQKYLFHMRFNKGKSVYEDQSLFLVDGEAAKRLIKTYDFVTRDGLEEGKIVKRSKLYWETVRIKEVKGKCETLKGSEKHACEDFVSKMEKERNDPVVK